MAHKLVSVWSLDRREEWVAYDMHSLTLVEGLLDEGKYKIRLPGNSPVTERFVYHDVPIQLLETPSGREYIALQPKLLAMLKAIINVKELRAALNDRDARINEKLVLIQEHAERLERIQGMSFWRRLGWALGLTELPL